LVKVVFSRFLRDRHLSTEVASFFHDLGLKESVFERVIFLGFLFLAFPDLKDSRTPICRLAYFARAVVE